MTIYNFSNFPFQTLQGDSITQIETFLNFPYYLILSTKLMEQTSIENPERDLMLERTSCLDLLRDPGEAGKA